MSLTAVNPSLDRAGRGGGRTAFERNILPGFAHWVIAEIEERRPDYLVPAETKGARVLEAVLRYAREELSSPITVPVLYGTALAYLDPEELASKRLMLVDDAVRTGANLAHHRTRARSFGAGEVEAIACLGAGERDDREVECFLAVDEDLYREYVWQLTELVVARGLPPEIDHHLYEVRLPRRLTGCWEQLAELLSAHGELTIDGPAPAAERLLGMTLHSPELPGRHLEQGEGFRAVDKIRFFPDLERECLYMVPVVFPPLALSDRGELEPLERTEARRRLPESLSGPGSIAEVLLSEAETITPKTLFRIGATAAEVDSALAITGLLGGAFPGASVAAQPESLSRLYGPDCGSRVAERLTQLIESAAPLAAEAPSAAGPHEHVFLDEPVVEATKSVIQHLRGLYREAKQDENSQFERVGLSAPEIAEFLDPPSPLLASRCIDYGMAMTALVPYLRYTPGAEGSALVERCYRVSEPLRTEEPSHEDVGEARVELSEQTLAVIIHNVLVRSAGERRAIGRQFLAALVSILRPLVLEAHSIPLRSVPGEDGPEILLADEARRVGIDDVQSLFFDYDHEAGGYVPTPHFLGRYGDGTLPVEVRRSVEDLEARLEMLMPVLDGLGDDEREQLLFGWAASTDERLGLSHVRHLLDAALAEMARTVKKVRRDRPHEPDGGRQGRVLGRVRAAATMLGVLEGAWQQPATERWRKELTLERHIRASLASPSKPLAFYRLPAALTDLTAELSTLVERLDEASITAASEAGQSTAEIDQISQATAEAAVFLRAALGTVGSVEAPPQRRPGVAVTEALVLCAGELEEAIKVLRALLAATAGAYRGPESPHLLLAPESDRHVAVLSLDIAGARAHRERHPQTHDAWKNDGLNIAAQWSRTLGGWEARARFGDDLLIEFDSADGALLCSALVQCHAEALASTGLEPITRRFHAAIDFGRVVTQTGGSNDGACMDRVTFVAKECDRSAETIDVYLSPEAWEACTHEMQEAGVCVEGWQRSISVDKGASEFEPTAIDSRRLFDLYVSRIEAYSRELSARVESLPELDSPIALVSTEETAEAEAGGGIAP